MANQAIETITHVKEYKKVLWFEFLQGQNNAYCNVCSNLKIKWE